ncbi:chemotaxis protein CheX [Candidatus Woesearchaeota archaeon]|nr:chemotaxis protein CheX [Candidatus Woesearchaeota archaeon]
MKHSDKIKKIHEEASDYCAKALSKMVDRNVKVDFPKILTCDSKDLFSMVDRIMVSNLGIIGDLRGDMLFVAREKHGLELVKVLMGGNVEYTNVDEDVESAYNETFNIIGGAYLSSLANNLDLKIFPNPPLFMSGESKLVTRDIVKKLNFKVGELLVVKTALHINNLEFTGEIYMILDKDSVKILSEVIKKV